MKARLVIEIKKIKDDKVNKDFVEKTPKLVKATNKTIKHLCKRIDEYFWQYKIFTKTKLEKLEIGET
jgi:hypothetical protein